MLDSTHETTHETAKRIDVSPAKDPRLSHTTPRKLADEILFHAGNERRLRRTVGDSEVAQRCGRSTS